MTQDTPATAVAQRPLPRSTAAWAAIYIARGLGVRRVRRGEKVPVGAGWTTRSQEPADFAPGDEVGILAGWLSDGGRPGHALVVVDLDSPAAVAAADAHLPPTGMIEGRPGKPRSHWYYLVPVDTIPRTEVSTARQSVAAARTAGRHPGPRKRTFRTGDRKTAIDLIGTGGQVAAPPSAHPSGETRTWDAGEPGDPAVLPYPDLLAAVTALAAAVGATRSRGRTAAVTRPNPQPRRAGWGVADPAATPDGTDPLARAARYLGGIPDHDLSRAGARGHDTLFRHVCAVVHGFALDDVGEVEDLFEVHYNARLRALHDAGGDEYEPWSADELHHKVEDALGTDPPAGKVRGWRLAGAEPAADLPMAWDNPRRLAEEMLGGRVYRFRGGYAYGYDGAGYALLPDADLRAAVRTHAEAAAAHYFRRHHRPPAGRGKTPPGRGGAPAVVPGVGATLVNNARDSLAALGRLPDDTPIDVWLNPDRTHEPRRLLTVENGLLDLADRRLLPHDPAWFGLTRLPVAYDPAAPAPAKWRAFLAEVLEGDAEREGVLQEVFGACLDARLRVKFFVALVGDGDNGKSVVLAVLGALLGGRNVSAVGLDRLTADRFASFEMYGKLANLGGDQSYFDSKDEGRLKELTGGDRVRFEQKGRDSFSAVNTAKLVFACNTLPTFGDKTDATWNRFVPVPFGYVVPRDRKNPALLTPEHWADELPGILNWALDGLARLRARGEFDLPQACLALKRQHQLDSNPARQFLAEEVRYSADDRDTLTTDELYRDYTTLCETSGHTRPLSKNRFGLEIGRIFPSVPRKQVRTSDGRTARGWSGLTWANRPARGSLLP